MFKRVIIFAFIVALVQPLRSAQAQRPTSRGPRCEYALVAPSRAWSYIHVLAKELNDLIRRSPLFMARDRAHYIRLTHDLALKMRDGNLLAASTLAAFQNFIKETPDKMEVLSSAGGSMQNLQEKPESILDMPTGLELYFLSLIPRLNILVDGRPEGALSALDSILCVRDRIRTKKFLLGLAETIRQLQARRPSDRPIRILDAGTGAIPLFAIFAATVFPSVSVTAIELNPKSAEIARQIIATLNLRNRIQLVVGDATRYDFSGRFDLIISETMHSALTEEPIVQIFSHLSAYLAPGGVMLPNEIIVLAAFVEKRAIVEPDGYVKFFDQVRRFIRADWYPVVQYRPGDHLEKIRFTKGVSHLAAGDYAILLASQVRIGSQLLDVYDSFITSPQLIEDDRDQATFLRVSPDGLASEITVDYMPGRSLIGALKTFR